MFPSNFVTDIKINVRYEFGAPINLLLPKYNKLTACYLVDISTHNANK